MYPQAAASAAAATVLRSHVAPPSLLAEISKELPGRDPQQIVTECVRVLCQWRDHVARQEDAGVYLLCCDFTCHWRLIAHPLLY